MDSSTGVESSPVDVIMDISEPDSIKTLSLPVVMLLPIDNLKRLRRGCHLSKGKPKLDVDVALGATRNLE
jgi:hypothetical protein